MADQLATPKFAPEIPEPMQTRMKTRNATQPEDRHVARPPRDLPLLRIGDQLQVENHGEIPFLFRWARRAYMCNPGEIQFVPFEALINQLGDPRSVEGEVIQFDDGDGTPESKGIILERYTELCRLFAMYGIEQESIPNLVDRAPKLTIKTLAGHVINFPIHVPGMVAYPAPLIDAQHVNSDTRHMFDQLSSENAELREQAERMEEQMQEIMRQREGIQDPA